MARRVPQEESVPGTGLSDCFLLALEGMRDGFVKQFSRRKNPNILGGSQYFGKDQIMWRGLFSRVSIGKSFGEGRGIAGPGRLLSSHNA